MRSETKLKVGLGLVLCLFLGGGIYVIQGMVKDLNAREVTRFMAEPAASYETSEDAVKKAIERYQQGTGPARLLARPASSSVLLVFDGLPSKTDTQRLLAVLRSHQVTALFFVEGENAAMDKELVRKIKEDGHLIGNFTFHGQARAEALPLDKFMKEVVDTQTALSDLTGSAPQYMRAPRTQVTADLLVRTAAAGLPVYVDTPLLFYPGQMATIDAVRTFALGVGGGSILAVESGVPVVGGPKKPKVQRGKNGPIEHPPTVKDRPEKSPSDEASLAEKVEVLIESLQQRGLKIVGL
ncbi:MAG: polysaccharide deacetylase family protein [Acidaminococcus sp.]|uniref:polysaccharide deacetylase family protein n=1 Tax=Acidaminococcus sp. TaxID=1872103 RepID=UPI002A752CC8|nr:polysaccharide deacetylase family protein [Acidaminococcus sp.]MDY2739215.1 polysaccharide deacetylase family protein [Acidaminococcus sp.]